MDIVFYAYLLDVGNRISFKYKRMMIKATNTIAILAIFLVMSCVAPQEKPVETQQEEQVLEEFPKGMLTQAYQLFKEGNDVESIQLANRVLEIGRATKNDTLIGKALTSLCRNSQRKLDTTRLAELSVELSDLSASSGNQKWLMYRAHMNAEMWRLIGDMDRAEGFYNESMRISYETGAMGMYTIDHFNKSFVSIAKGDFETANRLIKKYYQLRKEDDPESEDAYGLIALAYLLEQQENYTGAHEVAVVTRRLFEEQNLFPEPPDEKPLLLVEVKVKEVLDPVTFEDISKDSVSETVSSLLEKYLI
jgi:tetratricopeptide (TPR) repeat protein